MQSCSISLGGKWLWLVLSMLHDVYPPWKDYEWILICHYTLLFASRSVVMYTPMQPAKKIGKCKIVYRTVSHYASANFNTRAAIILKLLLTLTYHCAPTIPWHHMYTLHMISPDPTHWWLHMHTCIHTRTLIFSTSSTRGVAWCLPFWTWRKPSDISITAHLPHTKDDSCVVTIYKWKRIVIWYWLWDRKPCPHSEWTLQSSLMKTEAFTDSRNVGKVFRSQSRVSENSFFSRCLLGVATPNILPLCTLT